MDWKCTNNRCGEVGCEYNPRRWHEQDARVVDMEGDPRYCTRASLHNYGRPHNGVARVRK